MAGLDNIICPLCYSLSIVNYCSDKRRDYYHCEQCRLVFVPSCQHLSREAEKAHYDLHQNSPDDQGYRQFLSRLTNPLTAVLTPAARGLDFGSGPGPTLSVMLEEAGFDMAIYDIFYANNMSVLQSEYDFITTTEVVEHLSKPGKVLESLYFMIRPGGYLGLMTKMVLDQAAFSSWHYKNDQTHISFYSRETFNYLAQTWGASAEYLDDDVVLIKKPNK